jgi:hypothetical protein
VCRSIKTLRNFEEPPSQAEIEAAALQYVRKVSGYRRPALRNEQAFNAAVQEISAATGRLLDALEPARASAPAAARGA